MTFHRFLLTQVDLLERTHDQGPSFENEPPASELPVNFAEVTKGIYRSAFPQERNLPAMERLGLKTIVCVALHPSSILYASFLLIIDTIIGPSSKNPILRIIRPFFRKEA